MGLDLWVLWNLYNFLGLATSISYIIFYFFSSHFCQESCYPTLSSFPLYRIWFFSFLKNKILLFFFALYKFGSLILNNVSCEYYRKLNLLFVSSDHIFLLYILNNEIFKDPRFLLIFLQTILVHQSRNLEWISSNLPTGNCTISSQINTSTSPLWGGDI